MATTATAPGWRTTSRSKASPSGSTKWTRFTVMAQPPVDHLFAGLVELRQVVGRLQARLVPGAAAGQPTSPMSIRRGSRPSARTRAAPTSSRKRGWGSVGPALELRMGLGADPEGMAGQLDELDQPTVGGHARAHQADLLEPGAEAGVDLVAVPVALGHHLGPVGLGHLRAGQELGRRRSRAAWSRPCRPPRAGRPSGRPPGSGWWRRTPWSWPPPGRPGSRATSMIMTWSPRHRPSRGSSCSRA